MTIWMKLMILTMLGMYALWGQSESAPPSVGFELAIFGEYNQTVGTVTPPTHLNSSGNRNFIAAVPVSGFFSVGATPAVRVGVSPNWAVVLGPSLRYPVSGGTGNGVRVEKKITMGFAGEVRRYFGKNAVLGGYEYFQNGFETVGPQFVPAKVATVRNHVFLFGGKIGRVKISVGPLFAKVKHNTAGTGVSFKKPGVMVRIAVVGGT